MLACFQDGRKAVVTLEAFPTTISTFDVLDLQDGHDYVLEVSVAGDPAVQRRQDGAQRSAAPETSGGEPRCQTDYRTHQRHQDVGNITGTPARFRHRKLHASHDKICF